MGLILLDARVNIGHDMLEALGDLLHGWALRRVLCPALLYHLQHLLSTACHRFMYVI